MDQVQDKDYKTVLTEVIKKQMVILGPDITLAKARNVHGLTIADDGTVTNIQGHPQELIQSLIDQFVQLSGLIVKKTMEPLLSIYPDGNGVTESQSGQPTQSTIQPTPNQTQQTTIEPVNTPAEGVKQ